MRRRIFAMLVTTISLFPPFGAVAQADPVGGIYFECEMGIPEWPALFGGPVQCDGTITGVGVVGGEVITCVVACDFAASISDFTELCLFGGPPPHGIYDGFIYINGLPIGSFRWLRAGTAITFAPPGTLQGEGIFAPLPPIGTCVPGGSNFQTVFVSGHMFGT